MSSRLNYSKWDALELSDDSDIEGHPNVDKRSLIRWKQRDIHEKRETRKHHITHLQAQTACNQVLLPRIIEYAKKLKEESSPVAYYNSVVEQIEKNPSRDCPPGNDPTKLEQTYDGMILSLLHQLSNISKEKVKADGVPESERMEKLGKLLAEGMAEHAVRLGETINNDQAEMEKELQEQNKKITSDDIHEGFSSSRVSAKSEPAPISLEKHKKKPITTEFEVINPKGVGSASSDPAPSLAPEPGDGDTDDGDDDEEGLPSLTPSLEKFGQIPVGRYEESFRFIQEHRDVYAPGASDALLVAAFRVQQKGEKKLARKYVHQSLLLQYCEKLGRDGPRMFFQKIMSGDPRVVKVFVDDFENTYRILSERAQAILDEERQGREQIQLVPESPDQVITFNVPSGPPPENLVLEGPGTEGLDVEEVRKALQARWDVFESFPKELQEALESNLLENVNKVLGDIDVSTAEAIVQSLDAVGILNFAEGGIRDETGKGLQ